MIKLIIYVIEKKNKNKTFMFVHSFTIEIIFFRTYSQASHLAFWLDQPNQVLSISIMLPRNSPL